MNQPLPHAFEPYVGEDPVRSRIEVSTIGDLLLKAYDRYPDSPALVFPDCQWTYAELVERAMHTARGLKAMGVKPREHVGILMPTSPELVQVFFAVAFCGAVSVLINARYKANELAYVVENADLVTLVTTDTVAEHVDFVERLNTALPSLAGSTDAYRLVLDEAPRLRNLVLLGDSQPTGFVGRAAFYDHASRVSELEVHRTRVSVRLRDYGLILYTSGTTSNPKGCLITHEAMARNSSVLGRHRFQLTHDDKLWSPLPLFHIAAMLPLLAIIDVGGCYLGMGHFEPGLALKMLGEHKVSMVFSPFVTFLQALIYHPDFGATDLSSVRLMNSCFAAQPKSVGVAFRKAMPQTLQAGTFGMTEASGIVSTAHWGMDPELGFSRLGLPMIGQEVRIIDPESGLEMPVGERGEVLVRGYNLFDGYYRDPQKSAEALDTDGWFHTGDIGSLDENGHVMFYGRFKDMLKVGGENVAAAEIEVQLARHPAVKLAQVVGIPDEKYSEVPAAFIELAPGSQVSADELMAFCRSEISSFKVPRLVRFVEEWPMSASKIQKFQLRNALLRELGIHEQ
ncbi:class I adenylate-forming enzyme family protein [Pseudomonas sp. NBRC 100443]|uniref:class I adenylate-forming enzyme family protein n=1 Tax=Pseudomonas sp. NBRC 100443 TaxID=1113665 RepID=UPI0024A04019|nr:class I adenylate-forming enzyme family protein [Pseudomonas sp. NBRC 100443]GLU37315.1 AMP-dependent synthetase [Pseudomonas sp. NBRC 100443]